MKKPTQDALQYAEQFDGIDAGLDQGLLDTAVVALVLLFEVRRSINLAPSSRDRRLAQMCQAFFVGKVHRVTRAMVTLVRHGQGQEATALLREQNEFIIKLLYFQKHQAEATLFMVSSDVDRLRMAEANLKTAVSAKEEDERKALVSENKTIATRTWREFPALLVTCRKKRCKNSGKAHKHDLEFPNPRTMLGDLIKGWLTDAHAREGNPISKKELNGQAELLSNRIYLVRANFISQEKHGLPFALFNNVTLDGLAIEDAPEQVSEPNELLHWIVASVEPVLTDTVKDNAIAGYDERIDGFLSAIVACKERLQIPGPTPAITAFRVCQ